MPCVVMNVAVVNDAAERGINDIQEYANAAQNAFCRVRIVLAFNFHRPSCFLKNEMKENL